MKDPRRKDIATFLAAAVLILLSYLPATVGATTGDVTDAAVQVRQDSIRNSNTNPSTQQGSSLFLWREPQFESRTVLAQLQGPDPSEPKGQLKTVLSWETGEGKSYLVPALEIPGFIVLLNGFDRLVLNDKEKDGKKVYSTNLSTIWEHLHRQNWTFDQDSFKVNQFGHPYEGATMYGLARSSGLNFWQSLVYSNVGSFLWEMAGETSRPSINDQITTGNAGSLLGEALFRMAGLVLEDAGPNPALGHQLAAAAISPPTAFNRLAFGERFKEVYPNHQPATLWRCMAGGSANVHSHNLSPVVQPSSRDGNAIAEFAMAYGLPGKPGYSYNRPLDYFDFQISTRARTHNLVESLTIRGLLKGTDYHVGEDYRGIWGLYGSYDYISPYLFRVSSTALSLGTTGQYWAAPGIAVQGTVMGGVGFGATGLETDVAEERGYHFGATPQGLLALGVLLGDKTILDVSSRGYYVSALGPDKLKGSEFVFRGAAALTVRIYGHHAVGLHYSESIRDTNYANIPSRYRSEGTLSLVYTFLSDINLGAVEWRDAYQR
ncbi:hypothetical protein GEOBRER4_n0847 [Citrifermentans bremense]|uniref:DUF3943 domain-containing protein n=1 Tax=Citrifermentans bremense TaxID=60035 RepID=A0A6S6M212_9BACT|nr:hypothetical protein GEOBRER4_n0847 [Citrifermentans bremense]